MTDRSVVGDPDRPKRIYSPARNWHGSYFELQLVFDDRADDVLRRALAALWSHPAIWGCVRDKFPEPALQPRVEPRAAAQVLDRPWYGVAELPNGALVAAASFVTRGEGFAPEVRFGLPMGALGLAYPVGAYPFADGKSLAWRSEVSNWLASIGRSVFETQPFRVAMIEHEANLAGVDIEDLGAVPEPRWEGYLWPNNGRLEWHPQNRGAPFSF